MSLLLVFVVLFSSLSVIQREMVLGSILSSALQGKRQSVGPAPRAGHYMVYDEDHKHALLFCGGAGLNFMPPETWA